MDVKNAFLHGDLNETVFIKMPTGYLGLGIPISTITGEASSPCPQVPLKVCKLNKSLYGLKQAPRQWFAKLSLILKSFGFSQSKHDHSLFIKHHNNSHTVLLVYVVDLIISGNDSSEISATKQHLASQFHMKDLGPLRYFLALKLIVILLVYSSLNISILLTYFLNMGFETPNLSNCPWNLISNSIFM